MTFAATHSATSSPASEGGPTPCDLPDGPMTDLFGQALAPASHLAPRATSVAQTMLATYGLRSSASSASAALQSSLASRLPEVLGSLGGTMWRQTWKAIHTPQRRQLLAHTASARLTSGSEFTGWPTPEARAYRDITSNGLAYAAQRARHQPSPVTAAYLRGFKSDQLRFLLGRLMGYPDQWGQCAPTATPSSRK